MSTTTITTPSSLTLAPLTLAAVAAFSAGLAFAGAAAAQTETPAQARARAVTQSLNAGPVDSVLRADRVTASPPLTPAERAPTDTPAPPRFVPAPVQTPAAPVRSTPVPAAPPRASAPVRTTTGPTTASQTTTGQTTARPPQLDRPAANESVTEALNRLGLGDPNAPPPRDSGSAIPPLEIGYYVRGDMDCDQVWPGEGNLAWLSETSFVLDFGGCEPGAIQQIQDAVWREDQQCVTELGNNGGLYSVGYQVQSETVVARTTRLAMDRSEERDLWTHCATDAVPEEARFKSPS